MWMRWLSIPAGKQRGREVKGTGIKHRPDPIEDPACQKGMQKCAVAYYFNLLISLSISDGETRPIDLDNTSPRLK